MPDQDRRPTVSVVVVNYRGATDTVGCLEGLASLDWPAADLQIVVVDNDSGDGSPGTIRAAHPGVLVVESAVNTGFAGGCNLGVRHSTGSYVAFINSDARPDAQWLRSAVAVLEADSGVACVASKVLSWAGDTIDYDGAAMTWFGFGFKPHVGQPASQAEDRPGDVLFATGSAMVCRTITFRDVGGFDESFFMFFEDVDLGWRLNLLGYRVRYVPSSVVYHRHHSAIAKFGEFRETFYLERNALMSAYKNYGDASLEAVLPPALALTVRRGLEAGGLDPSGFDIVAGAADESLTMPVDKAAMARFMAVGSWVDAIPALLPRRAEVQRRRRCSDAQLAQLFGDAHEPAFALPRYVAAHRVLSALFAVDEAIGRRRRVLVVTGDVLAAKMAGPGIRASNIAEQLAQEHDVRLVSTSRAEAAELARQRSFEVAAARTPRQLRQHERWADVIVVQGHALTLAPWLVDSAKVIVCDLYDPMHLEALEQTRLIDIEDAERRRRVGAATHTLNVQLARGDFFLCASEAQRRFWLGQLAAHGRLNPSTYDADTTLGGLLAVVPFGLPDEPPVATRHAIRDTVPGIAPDDKVILWAGGLYNWFDPATLIEAVDRLRHRRADVRLFILGGRNPNPDVPVMRVATEAVELSDRLGLTDRFVFFYNDWVDYDDRQNFLLDADIGVSTHREHLETIFAFRTRILDYLWAGLPVVASDGDAFADLIRRDELGRVVSPGDPEALAAALETALYDADVVREFRANVARVATQFRWSTVVQPLVEFCRVPHRAADAAVAAPVGEAPEPPPSTVTGDLRLMRDYLVAGGPVEVGRRAAGRIRRSWHARRP